MNSFDDLTQSALAVMVVAVVAVSLSCVLMEIACHSMDWFDDYFLR